MRLRLRCRRKRTSIFAGWGTEPKPAPVTRLPDGFLCFDGRVEPLELIVRALNESGATGVGRVLSYEPYDGDGRG
jgi:hypothetical protein